MFIIFLALIIGPIFAGKFLKSLPSIPMQLLQPTGQNNNDTNGRVQTGSALVKIGSQAAASGSGAAASGSGAAAATTSA